MSADTEADVDDSRPLELTSSLRIFRRERDHADELPSARIRSLESVAAGFDRNIRPLGVPLLEESRRALPPSARSVDDGVFLVPTQAGGVCYSVGDIGLGCMTRLIDRVIGWNLVYRPIEPVHGEYEIISVHGVVADSVREVEVVFADGAGEPLKLSATVGGNAFRLSLPSEQRINPLSMRGLEVGTTDGSRIWVSARN